MSDFEKWFVDQDFYTNMRFIYGENLFHKDLGAYRILPVQMTFKAWSQQQAAIDELQSQLNSMEACYIEKKNQVEDQQKRIDKALICVDRATDGYYGFSEEGGDTDNLAKHLEKALRGEHE